MREVSERTAALIADGGFARTWLADLMYDGQRRLANVAVTDVKLNWDGAAFVVGSGSLRVVWSDDHATSMVPRDMTDWFAPFGAELQVDCLIGAGVFTERVPMGRFVIESVPDADEASMLWQGRLIHPGESFGVRLKDGLVRVSRDRYAFPTPSSSTSVWSEIQTVTGLPLIRNLPDAAITTAVTHDEEKASATSALFDRLGGWPMLNSSGVLMARPKQWPTAVDTLTGRTVSKPRSLTSEHTFNSVVVKGKAPDGSPLYGIAQVREGELRVQNADGSPSPFGVATYTYSSDFLTTQQQVDDYAAELLGRVSRIRGVVRDVTERFNPLREVGDVLELDGGLVRALTVSHTGALTEMTVEVPDE